MLKVKLPPFKFKLTSISIVEALSTRFKAFDELEIEELMSIVPPVSVKVALDPDDFEIEALTVSVLDEELPVVIETFTPELSEVLMDEAKIVVVVEGVKELE